MSASVLLRRVFTQVNTQISNYCTSPYAKIPITTKFDRNTKRWRPVKLPKPGLGRAYRRIVHFQDKYTVEPLKTTNLGGRDPNTGRRICIGIGGGIKHKYHQIKQFRDGPSEGAPKEEKVLKVFKDGCRTGFVALVGSGDELKYIIATENMKEGDIIRSFTGIPRISVLAKEGDAYPLGALPMGTVVHNIQMLPGKDIFYVKAAGSKATILRKDEDDRIVVRMPGKRPKEFSFDKHCMATVGQVSNVIHGKTPIGSAQKNRELGNRPRSGLWHRKDGRHGRKIKPPPPIKKIRATDTPKVKKIQLTLSSM